MNNNEFITLTGEDRESIEQSNSSSENYQVKEFVDKDGSVRRQFSIDVSELSEAQSEILIQNLKEKFSKLH